MATPPPAGAATPMPLAALLRDYRPAGSPHVRCDGSPGCYQRDLELHLAAVGAVTEPVLLGPDGRVWDGHHRIVAARRLGFASVPAETPPGAGAAGGAHDLPLDYAVWLLAVCERAGLHVDALIGNAPGPVRGDLARRWGRLADRTADLRCRDTVVTGVRHGWSPAAPTTAPWAPNAPRSRPRPTTRSTTAPRSTPACGARRRTTAPPSPPSPTRRSPPPRGSCGPTGTTCPPETLRRAILAALVHA